MSDLKEFFAKFDKEAIDKKIRENMPFNHRWHNRFHLEMPFGLINDPNGLAFFDGKYHIFFQWNPFGCEHKNKCWAHVETKDFVKYSTPELALWPTDVHDKDGCYSGCGFVEDEKLWVLYTCNSKDENNLRTPAQRLGLFENGKVEKNDIIVPKNEEGYTPHYRDPYVFYRGGKRYFALGAQRENETGCVVIYREGKDGPEFLGELNTKKSNEDFGYMWECPGVMRFGDYDVLMFCPQGLAERDFKYQNKYQSGYLVGHISLEGMEMLHGRFMEFDHGFDFYAPQVFNHGGRHIMIGWLGMPDKDDEYPTKEHGWQYSLSLPRVLTLRQGHIYQQPVTELKKLRIEDTVVDLDGANTTTARATLGEGAEIILDVNLGEARKLQLTLAYGQEQLVYRYDRRNQVMTVDRTGMKLGGRGVRRFKLYTDDSEPRLHLHLYVDRAAVEAYFQHGEEVATALVYPEKNILPEMILESDRPMENYTGRVWELDSFKFRA